MPKFLRRVELTITFCAFTALAHQYSFPYKTFQINDLDGDGNWFKNFLSSLDVDDVRQDISEHFGVVGDRIAGTFRSQPSYLQYSETDRLTSPSTYQSSVVAVTRVKKQSYGTASGDGSSQKYKTEAIGKSNKRYRIVEIEDTEQTPSSSTRTTASTSNMTQSMMSTTSTTSSYGINVRGPENDPINYRNPDV